MVPLRYVAECAGHVTERRYDSELADARGERDPCHGEDGAFCPLVKPQTATPVPAPPPSSTSPGASAQAPKDSPASDRAWRSARALVQAASRRVSEYTYLPPRSARGTGSNHASDDREDERLVQPVSERSRYERREEAPAR